MNILITGGSSGLGEAITRLLATDSTHKIYFTFAKSQDKSNKITSDFKNTTAIKCDFKNTNEVDDLVNSISTLDIDILINNAYTGTVINTHFHKISEDDFSQDFTVNIIPTLRITQAVIKIFRKKKSGKIISILTSALVNTPPTGTSTYVANKAYLQSMVKSWASENNKFNISSNSVSPAFMQTFLTAAVDERLVEQMEASHPLKTLLTVNEVAETVQFLTTASNQINGVDFLINAGVNIK